MLGHLELVVVALQILILLPHIGSGDNIGLASGLEMMLEIPGLFGRFHFYFVFAGQIAVFGYSFYSSLYGSLSRCKCTPDLFRGGWFFDDNFYE